MSTLAVPGMRIKLIRGEQNYYGQGKHSEFGEWIAGQIPVGSTGTVQIQNDKHKPLCIIWDHNPTPKAGYYWGIYTINDSFEIIDI